MLIKGNNGQSAARKRQPKSASSSTKSSRSNTVSKGSSRSNNGKAADKLDGDLIYSESPAVESKAGDRVLETAGIGEATSGNDLSSESTKLEAWNSADFGQAEYKSDEGGQLNFLEVSEPPDPDDFKSKEEFEEAYKHWADFQTDEAEEELANFGEQELCNQLMDGSTFAAESVQDSPMPESNFGSGAQITSASGIVTAEKSLSEDSLELSDSTTLKSSTSNASTTESSLLPQVLPANPSQLTEIDSDLVTPETAFPMSLEESENSSQILQSLKTSQDYSTALSNQEAQKEHLLELFSAVYTPTGTMWNGKLSAAPTLEAPGVESESLLLRSPGALSGSAGVRPPGKTKLETQLNQLGLIQDGEVVAPEFLELGYNLPVSWTNPQENRTALELSQVQAQQSSIDHKSELLPAMETTAIVEKPSETPLTGELLLSDSSELNISVILPPNIGALSKAELIAMAGEQHQLICGIERRQFRLSFERLYRIHVTGVVLIEFKKRCQYGEFVEQLETHGINPRVAQNYMTVSKNWELIEAKAHLSALLSEENNEVPTLGINWALQVIRDEKKQLKQEAPPKSSDDWRTPNTTDQPVVKLVRKALGGDIWLDPCSDPASSIPASVRYWKTSDGLAQHNTWSKTVFINPPFSDPFPWVERCCLEVARGNVSAAVMLLKAGVVANIGTGELINKYASAICHWRGRINFLNDEGNPVKGSDFDCVFIYFGTRLDLFREAFGGRGTIATIENHYSSVNKKFMTPNEKPVFGNVEEEQKQLAAAVGLGNGGGGGGGRSLLPDLRDSDRERMERYDPHTVSSLVSMPPTTATIAVSNNQFQPIAEPESFDETPLVTRQFEVAKQNTLNDYIISISSNLSEFSDDQIAFLAKIINEESVKRIGF